MYLFISSDQILKIKEYKDFECDYLYSNNLKTLQKNVIKYEKLSAKKAKEKPGELIFQKRYGAVVYKYGGDLIGWIIKLSNEIK